MSMTTTCPKCNTNFRVTSEQLAAREGKLRCGRCAQVFNGFMYLGTPLEPETERSLPRRPVVTQPVSAEAAPVEDNQDGATPFTILPDLSDAAPFDYQGQALPDEFLAKPYSDSPPITLHQAATLGHENIDLPDVAPSYEPEPWPIIKNTPDKIESYSPIAEPLRSPASSSAKKPVALKPVETSDDFDDASPDPLKEYFKDEVDDDDAFDGPTLLDDAANKRAKPHWAWTVGCLLLFFAAALQAVYLFRVDIALAFPDTRPLLAEACGLLNCEVGLPQNLDSLSIESSDLVADPTKPDQIELRATLRNKARHVQAYPNLDFNLTDAQDDVLVKKIVTPATYLKPPAAPNVGFAPNAEINIKLQFSAKNIKPAGYRLLLFYP
jgi:predicted Zn finger-like uncharacterized protein